MGRLATIAYDQQLRWLGERVAVFRAQGVTISNRGMENLLMLLSIAESVKEARECNLNHGNDPHAKR